MATESLNNSVGIVAIGRNEGERLRRCLTSVLGQAALVIYVDSASTDGSVALARSMGASVVELNLSVPFTAARARNAGVEQLLRERPDLQFIQFLDADTEVQPNWLKTALDVMLARPELAVACGRRRERAPHESKYNLLCDMEWNTPVGDAKYCGGDAMMRVAAFQQVTGYEPTMIAGEEPELCVRLRQYGWKITRLDAEMTLHDAAMTRFGQWWKRSIRAGHAFAEGAARHGEPPEFHWLRESRSNWIWGLVIPLIAIAAAYPTWGLSFLMLLIYPVQAMRIDRGLHRNGVAAQDARLYALFCVVGKFPQMVGQTKYWFGRVRGRQTTLIEYKGAQGLARPAGNI